MTGNDRKPSWWLENKRLKEGEMELPEYEPPRFKNGVYTHLVVTELQEEYGYMIRFAGKNTRYLDDWQVRVDHQPVMSIGRRRDNNGNTIYTMTSDSFRKKMSSILEDH
ncbi:hypothetical protein [Halorientalis marina]|jgi:hypothetical protein|uniref:hypothetical protein n=1 Tax=Halorientalis marina TaxID=2931976 RepID=UPI001FF66F08|nr:hypothetical protein [Halorientalis marina]